MNKLRKHTGLLILLTAFLALGTIYLRVTPLLETPDEPSHFSVVKYMADEARLPPLQPLPPDAGPVPLVPQGPPTYYAPPLYYALGALLILDLDTDGFSEAVIPNPNWARGWAPTPGRSPENKHIYVHSADQRPPYAGWAVAMLRLRVFSLLLGGATVSGVYALARSLLAKSWALAATALVAFNPAFLFVTVGVTNDALLFALSSWAFALMARLGRRPLPHKQRLMILLSIVMGLTALTKQTALIFFPAAALAVCWGGQGARGKGQVQGDKERHATCLMFDVLRLPGPRRGAEWGTFHHLFLAFGVAALIAGWWYLRNALLYDDSLGFRPHQVSRGVWHVSASLILRQLGQALQGYWGAFGWGLILLEPVFYFFLAAFALGGVAGLLRPRTPLASRPSLLLCLGVLLNLIGLLLWLLRTSAPYGRLLFPTLGPLAVLLVMGWRRWLGERCGWPFAWGVALAFGLYALVVPFRYLKPAYTNPVVSDSALENATPLDVQFDGGVRLLGYHLASERAQPGDRATLTLYWKTTSPQERDLRTFIQLAPHDPEKRVAGLDAFLGSTRYPTSVWQPGEVIEQIYDLKLPQDAPAPGFYWFNVGLYGRKPGERLPGLADGAPLPGGTLWLGPLRVTGQDVAKPQHEIDYRLGSTIRLTGYDLELGPTDTITLTLHWQAVAAPGEGWVVFVHLLDAAGHPVVQDDGPPRQGDYPTGAWEAGDHVPDRRVLDLPSDPAPGPYRLQVGLYRPNDGTRMPAFDPADQRMPNDAILLVEIDLSDQE